MGYEFSCNLLKIDFLIPDKSNMMKFVLISTTLFSILSGCSTFEGVNNEVKLSQESTVTFESGEKLKVEKEKAVSLDKGPVLIESPGHLGVLVVPIKDKDQSVNVRLKKLNKENFGDQFQAIYNQEMTQILGEVYKVQKLIHENKKQDALVQVQRLKDKFPGLTYLSFLEASVYLVMGDKGKTKQLLEVALTNYPDNQEAMDLYISLLDKGEKNKFLTE